MDRPEAPCATGLWYYGMSAWKNLRAETGEFKFQELIPGDNGLVEVGKMFWDAMTGQYVPERHAFGPLAVNTGDVDNDGDLDVLGVTPTDPSWHVQSDMIAGRFWENLNDGPGDFRFRVATEDAGLFGLNWTYGQWGAFWEIPDPIPEVTTYISAACSEALAVNTMPVRICAPRSQPRWAGGPLLSDIQGKQRQSARPAYAS